MQLAMNNGTAVISGGVLESNDFTMQVDGKMFKILSDTLYQNKIGSMIREVSCNAMDSHLQAGKGDVPFSIHAPNALEPWFSVKDYGVGLSHEEVVRIFTCFGKSTKTDSNTQVGAFGFGSKSPFAYTNSFTIISVKDGVKRNYNAVIKEDGTPTTMLLDASYSDEINGVEIMVGVEPRDFHTFADEVLNQLAFFKVKPNITGNATIKFKDEFAGVTESLDGIHFREVYGRALIVQGGVSYPLNAYSITQAVENDKEMKKFIDSVVNNLSPIIFFEIGEIEVTPSRESVSYSKRTIENIINRLRAVKDKLHSVLEARVAAIPTQWEQAIFLQKNYRLFSAVTDLSSNKWNVHFEYDGKARISLPESIRTKVEDDVNGRVTHTVTLYNNRVTRNSNTVMQNGVFGYVLPSENVVFVIDDGSSLSKERIRNFLGDSRKSGVYFLTAAKADAIKTKVTKVIGVGEDVPEYELVGYGNSYKTTVNPAIVDELKLAFIGAKFFMLADLPKPEREKIVRESGETVDKPRYVPAKMYKYNGSGSLQFKDFDKDFVSPKSIAENVAYVMVNNRSITSSLTEENARFFTALVQTDKWDVPLYAVREHDIVKLADNPLWTNLNTVVEALRQEYLIKYKNAYIKEAIRNNIGNHLDAILGSHFMDHLVEQKKKTGMYLIDDSDINRCTKWWANRRKNHEPDSIITLLFSKEIQEIDAKLAIREKTVTDRIEQKYPILSYCNVGWRSNDTEFKIFVNTINTLAKAAKGDCIIPSTVV